MKKKARKGAGGNMKKIRRVTSAAIALCAGLAITSCKKMTDDTVKLTIWVSEADKPFATSVAEEFKAKHPEKQYRITIDIQGENDVVTLVLNDV